MDLLNTRNKEKQFMDTCFETESKFVVDNTNPTIEDRAKYIRLAQENNYEVVGYYFSSSIEESLDRNKQRKGKEVIPDVGIRSCYSKLEIPTKSEGFDKLYFVKISDGKFIIEDWKDEV